MENVIRVRHCSLSLHILWALEEEQNDKVENSNSEQRKSIQMHIFPSVWQRLRSWHNTHRRTQADSGRENEKCRGVTKEERRSQHTRTKKNSFRWIPFDFSCVPNKTHTTVFVLPIEHQYVPNGLYIICEWSITLWYRHHHKPIEINNTATTPGTQQQKIKAHWYNISRVAP